MMNRQKKLLICTAFLLFLILAIMWAYHTFRYGHTSQERHFNDALRDAVESHKTSGSLKKLTNFNWDEVCVFPPYSGLNNEHEGYEIIGDLPSSNQDGEWYILFKNFKLHKAYSIRPRIAPAVIDFNCSSNEELTFHISYDPTPHMQLKK